MAGSPPPSLPGRGLLGWLGRQVGYVSHAVRHDPAASHSAGPQTLYRASTIEEKPLPAAPNVLLRRTTIDEVIVKKQPPSDAGPAQ